MIVEPPLFEPLNAAYVCTDINLLTVELTANWILNLSRFCGWVEGEKYAKTFRTQDITGPDLKDLTDELLHFDFWIENKKHRMAIVTAIKHLQSSGSGCIFTNIESLTVAQTAHWVLKFGAFSGWVQREDYAERFREQEVSGKELKRLRIGHLQSHLGICNKKHEIELLSAIKSQWHPSGAAWVCTHIEDLTTEQIANYIVRLGESSGWVQQREEYAEMFRKNEIFGNQLKQLEHHHLEFVGIKNENHRMELLSVFKSLHHVFSKLTDSHLRDFINPVARTIAMVDNEHPSYSDGY